MPRFQLICKIEHVAMAVIAAAAILVPYHVVKSVLQPW